MILRIFILLCKISYILIFAQYVKVENAKVSMTHAYIKCHDEGGYLVPIEQLHQSARIIREQCAKGTDEYYWIGNYSAITPFLFLEGCFQYKNVTTRSFKIKDNSVAKCSARCENDDGIAIMNEVCQCVTNRKDALETLQRIDVGQCNIHHNEEILGGFLSAIVVCLHENDGISTTGINPNCFYGKCDGSRYFTFLSCSYMNSAQVLCDSNASSNSTSWWEAMEECISNHSSYLVKPEQFKKKVSSLCVTNDNILTWTNQREYKDEVVIPDIGIRENFIFSTSIVCKAANLTDFSLIETRECNRFSLEGHGYVCYFDAETTQNVTGDDTTCVVNLNLDTSSSTNKEYTTSTDQDMARSTFSQTSSYNLIAIVAIVSGGVILLALLIGAIVLLRVLKSREKKNERRSLIYEDSVAHGAKTIQRQEYEEIRDINNHQNPKVCEKCKRNKIDNRKYYEDLQNVDTRDEGQCHIYDECIGDVAHREGVKSSPISESFQNEEYELQKL